MPTAKQIKAQKLFAKRVKRGDFRKAIAKTKKKKGDRTLSGKKRRIDDIDSSFPEKNRPQPMTEKELKGFPDDDWFKEYKRLGGKKTRKQYEKNVDIFVYHTHDIFIHGDASKYKNRGEALEAVKKEAKIDNKELNKLFDSISNITAWT